jgi:riboflavin synthase
LFTGLIKELGQILSINPDGDGLLIKFAAPTLGQYLKRGGSININGACQSAINIDQSGIQVFATAETVAKTTFQRLLPGNFINLELPLTLNDPLGGHLILGHVDCVGKIKSFVRNFNSAILEVEYNHSFESYLVEKGSIAVDGISLTCFDISNTSFSVAVIPETIKTTNLQFLKSGDYVNLEFDIFAKYIQKNINKHSNALSVEYLNQHGFEVRHD